MSAASHTPGPWFAKRNTADYFDIAVGPNDYDQHIASAMPNEYVHVSVDGAQANARLMAASPELVDALFEVEEYLDDRADADCDQDGYIPNREMQLLAVVRVALAKAGVAS